MVPNTVFRSPLTDNLLNGVLDDDASDLNTSVFGRDVVHDDPDRETKNTKGVKEEWVGPRKSVDINIETPAVRSNGNILTIVFVSMIIIGLGNRVFNKLQTIPMYNYPNFLNLLTTFIYIPVCFAYIIPMARSGGIPRYQLMMSKRPFLIMGVLDAIASIMQIFAATYLPGPLITLLLQAAIPISMIISKYLVKAQYDIFQYFGAVIVVCGIMTVLSPSISGGGSALWACVLIASTIPMTLSSVYKELALGETEIDPMYLNGWVAVFQFFFALILCVPSSLASSPPVPIPDLPRNLLDGLYCYGGVNSVTCADDSSSCTPDDCFPDGPIFVNIYMFFNQVYNLLIILLLKYGSSNLLYLALTLMAPLANVAFTLPFMPERSTLKPTDIIGLVIICIGLACYRFAGELYRQYQDRRARSLSQWQDRKLAVGGPPGGRSSGGWLMGRSAEPSASVNVDRMRQLLLDDDDDDESSEFR